MEQLNIRPIPIRLRLKIVIDWTRDEFIVNVKINVSVKSEAPYKNVQQKNF